MQYTSYHYGILNMCTNNSLGFNDYNDFVLVSLIEIWDTHHQPAQVSKNMEKCIIAKHVDRHSKDNQNICHTHVRNNVDDDQ